jgi:phosphoribosylanthranilate isomerase
LGADWIGLVFFEKSPRNVTLDQARSLATLAKGRAKVVALSVDADDASLGAIVDAANPDWFQLHGREPAERVAQIRATFGVPTMKAIGVATLDDLTIARGYTSSADRLLLDSKPRPSATRPGGNGTAFDWSLPRRIQLNAPWMLSGGLDAGNVAEAIDRSGAEAVDVSSGVESAPGVKDPSMIKAFIRAARDAFARSAGQRELA